MVYQLINDCIDSERQRGLRPETIKELKRYLHEFADYCQSKLHRLEDMTSDFLREYVMIRGKDRDKSVKKAVVWCLRKFGTYLLLRGRLAYNPAKPLRHPKISPRKELPRYLKKDELQALLIYASKHACQRDFTILALIVITGMRPSAIAALQKNHFSPSGQYIIETLKGGGFKKTALNESVCMMLQAYLDSRTDGSLAMFLTDRNKPMYISRVQKTEKPSPKP